MQRNYGMAWGDTASLPEVKRLKKLEWFNMLKDYTEEAIEKAIALSIRQHPTFPPKLGEFLAICDQLREQQRFPEFDRSRAIEQKPYMSEKNRLAWEEARRKLGVPRGT